MAKTPKIPRPQKTFKTNPFDAGAKVGTNGMKIKGVGQKLYWQKGKVYPCKTYTPEELAEINEAFIELQLEERKGK